MPFSLDIKVFPKEDCRLPHPCSYLLYAAVLSNVYDVDPEASASLHDDAQVKPFSVSTLWPRTRVKGDFMDIPKYTECRFRFSTLDQDTFDIMSSPFFKMLATNGNFRLKNINFYLTDTNIINENINIISYKELYSDIGKHAIIRFLSPTTFRRKGLNVPLPDPLLVYGSLWHKWQAFSDINVEESVFDEMISVLAISKMQINTRMWKFSKYALNGFTGIVEYELVKNVSVNAKKLFGALSRLAFFSGVGYKTTMGMGQCRLLSNTENNKE